MGASIRNMKLSSLRHTVLQRRGRGEMRMEVGRGFNLKVVVQAGLSHEHALKNTPT